ncbi:4-hydroxyphenylpyruvate dioxygenase [Klebsiella pneumoniae]|nr:4-hydroxyphenylpyruvate dioxygenase [Klebsiella pneumoniae]
MRFSTNPLFINTVLLGGNPQEKLAAAARAGFAQVELWQQDVEAAEGGVESLTALCRSCSLGLTDYQVLLDFDGAPDDLRDSKRQEALRMMTTAQQLGASTVLVPASTHARCQAERVEDDLRWLVAQAAGRGLRVAYEAMAWSQQINNTAAAWQLVKRIDAPNLGLVVDAFHIFVRQRSVEDLAGIPADKIYLVQLSDLDKQPEDGSLVDVARHQRLLPGEGHYPLEDLLGHLQKIDYRGPIGLEVFNDRRKAADPFATAAAAMNALRSVL